MRSPALHVRTRPMSPVLEDVDVVVPDRRIGEREGDFTSVGRCFLDQLIDAGVDVLAVALVDRAFAEGDAPVVVRNNLEEIRGIGVGNELSFVGIESNADIPVAGVRGCGRSGTRPEESDSTGRDRYQQRSYSHT